MITPETMVDLRFRRMTSQDVEQVYAIDVLSFSLPWSLRSYSYEVNENKNSRNWVAEAVDAQGHTQVVAMVVVWLILDEAHVATFAIHPDFRRLGIGRRLLATALLYAAEQGARQAYLEVRRSNQAALNLYYQFGFLVVGVRSGYYQDTHEDALLMTLSPIPISSLRKLV